MNSVLILKKMGSPRVNTESNGLPLSLKVINFNINNNVWGQLKFHLLSVFATVQTYGTWQENVQFVIYWNLMMASVAVVDKSNGCFMLDDGFSFSCCVCRLCFCCFSSCHLR